MSTTRIYYVRHGQSVGNVGGLPAEEQVKEKHGEGANDRLTSLGMRQAFALAANLAIQHESRKLPAFDIVYCSPCLRAMQTALQYKNLMDCPVLVLPALAEVSMRPPATKTEMAAKTWRHRELHYRKVDFQGFQWVGDPVLPARNQTRAEGFLRVEQAIPMLTSYENANILVFAHGNLGRLLFTRLMQATSSYTEQLTNKLVLPLTFHNASLSILERQRKFGRPFRLIRHNDTSHLPEELINHEA